MTLAGSADFPGLSDRYEVRREIGRGGMATVYLADDLKHDRQVAIKVLLPELSAAIGVDRFSREIRMVARLQHPHILPLFDSGAAGELLYFVMPFVEGESLRELLSREGSLTLEHSARVVRHIGDALDHAHARGIVHRDIKPENILLSAGQAFLADFGVARALVKDGLATLTSVGMTLGTPAYMSPEQASGETDIDGRSDLYALGCIAQEMLSGSPPFAGANAMGTMAQHITRPPPKLTSPRGIVSDAVVEAVARMLSKDPGDRFASASEFAGLLETAVGYEQSGVATIAPARHIERATGAEHTVFVLDFSNLANAPDVDWLAGGIADSVSADLRKIGGIRIVGIDAPTRQRVATALGSGAITADVARSLGRSVGARWVVWGAFQKSGSRIRLTPQFGNVESGDSSNMAKIDGTLDEIFELQDRIVLQLAEILRIELTSVEAEHIARPETAKVSAYELYALGMRARQQFGVESTRAAAEYFRAAVDIDPEYALAWTGLGGMLMPKYIATGDPTVLDEGVQALERALMLDPTLGEPHAYLAYMYAQQHRYDEAIAVSRLSLEREPGSFMGWYIHGISLLSRALSTGKLEDLPRATSPLLRARAINPSFHPASMALALIYVLRGEYEPATVLVDEAVALEHAGTGLNFLGSFVQRARLHAFSGEQRAAVELLDATIAKYAASDHVYAKTMLAWGLVSRARVAEHAAEYDEARRYYERAFDVAEAHDHRLGVGSHWVSAKLGMCRMAFRRGEWLRSDTLLAEAADMLKRRHRFRWVNLAGCSTAESHYETAATHALRGEIGLTLQRLEQAARHGWADQHQLDSDPNFDAVRESSEMRDLMVRATSMVTLPPPVGPGGFPSHFGEPGSRVPSPPAV